MNGVHMETLKTSATLIEELVSSKQDEDGNLFRAKFPRVSQSFDLGKVKCEESAFPPVADTRCVDSNNIKGVDSIKGISLFVELTGAVAKKPDDVKNRLLKENEVKVDVGQQEDRVNVGDLVWAIIKKQKWWPGIVCDAINAPEEVAKQPTREDDILVKCFGNGSYIWCSPYEVRPFVGYFDQLPNQSNAKKFLEALEKAVTELGNRVKDELTCSCFSKMKIEKAGNFGGFLFTLFEPEEFLDYVKDLGKDVSMANKIDCVVKQSCLSAFHRSKGHLQIPMHQLKPAGDESNGDVNGVDFDKTSGESQPVKKPRKKWTRKNKVVQENMCSSEVVSQLQFAAQDCLFPCESKNFDSVKRFISGFRKRVFNDSSSEAPVDVPNHQNLQETLPKRVRKKKDKSVISPAVQNGVNHGSQFVNFQNVGSFNLGANQNPYFTFGYQPPTQLPTQPPLRKLAPKRPNNVAQNVTPMPTWNADVSTLPNVNYMGGLYQAPVFFTNDFGSPPQYFTGYHGQPQVGPVPTGVTPVPKKRGRKRKNIDLQANPGPTNLQANPSSTMYFQANPGPGSTMQLQANPGPTMHLQANPGPTMHLQANPGSTTHLQANPGSTTHLQANRGPTMHLQANSSPTMHLQANSVPSMHLQANPGSTMLQANSGSPMHVQANPGYPGSTMHLQASPGSTMHLQANPGYPGSTMHLHSNPGYPGSTMPLQADTGSTKIPNLNGSITGSKKQKRDKRSLETGVPCIDLRYNKVQQDDLEVKGTAFLLKFSSDYPLPSIQDLNSVFSKFGALVESETQVWNENLSGQVVFLDSSSAGGAFWGLQNDKPFGPVLVNYKIQHLTGSESMVPFKTPIKSPSGPSKPTDSKIPDLNTNSSEVQIVKRSKTVEEIRLPINHNSLSYNKVNQGNEVTGTALLLTFSPNFPLPSVQDLNWVFCKYGELNERETRVSGQDFTGQVVFVNPSTAADAVHRLDKDQPFGLALISYQVHHLNNVQNVGWVKNPVMASLEMKPRQDLGVIKKNLEMMNLMLEKSGDSLTPEMRGKLESEIKGLMKKLSGVDGSSSSSCL